MSDDRVDIGTWRKRLRFRAWHRGMREMDLILGRFADRFLPGYDEATLEEFEMLLQLPDPELLGWVTGEFAIPAAYDTPLVRSLAEFGRGGIGGVGDGA